MENGSLNPDSLSPRDVLIAFLDTLNHTNAQIALKVGCSVATLTKVRKNPAFKLKKAEIQHRVEEELIREASNLALRFDLEASKAFDTLVELHTGAEMETVRLGAAKDILDRAPNAPKPQKLTDGTPSGVTIVLGAPVVEGMMEALKDIGESETIELLEGEGFREIATEESDEREFKVTEV